MSEPVPFRYLVCTPDDPLSNFFAAGVYFKDQVPAEDRDALVDRLPLPLRYESPMWGSAFLWVRSQEYPGVAVRFAYNVEIQRRAAAERWDVSDFELFERVTQTHDDEPSDDEAAAFMKDLDHWIRQLHERRPIGLLVVEGPWPLDSYNDALVASVAAFPECARYLQRDLDTTLEDSPYLLGNLAYSVSLRVANDLDALGQRSLVELAQHAIACGKDSQGHWQRLISGRA